MIGKLFTDLLAFGLFDRPLPEGSAELFQDRASELFSLAKYHDLVYALAVSLDKCKVSVGGEVGSKIEGERLLTLYRYENLRFTAKELSDALERGGIPHMLLKGALVRELYSDPMARTSCDVDVLVKPEDTERAIECLCEGCKYKLESRNYHDFSLYTPGGVHVELHFELGEAIKNAAAVYGRVWEYAKPVYGKHFEYRMTGEYLLFHTIAHAAYDFTNGGFGIKAVTDVAMLSDFDSCDLLEEAGLSSFANAMHQLAGAWFFGENYSDTAQKMGDFILSSGVYGTHENKISASKSPKPSRFGYLMGRIFLPYAQLKRLYPVIERHKILTPFCQVRRWFRLLRGGAARRSVSEAKTAVTLDVSYREGVQNLIAELELN